jgi:trk system potassium uptake protein TrkH
VKTVSAAVVALTLRATLRGRQHVEAFHRTLPTRLIYRALLIVALAAGLVVVFTLLLVVVEGRPGRFLDHLFEATSALGTVGLSAEVTPGLSQGGRVIVVLAMFLGRVGPLTLLMALASNHAAEHYRYPEERVLLG